MNNQIQRLTAEGGIDAESEGHYRDITGIENTSGPHTHDFFEFFVIIEGAAYHCINGKRELLNEGALVFMRPQDVHYYEPLPGTDCRLINLSFYEKTQLDLLAYLGPGFPKESFLSAAFPIVIQLSQQEKRLLQHRMEKLYRIPQHEKQWYRAELRALLAEVYCHYLMHSVIPGVSEKPAWFLDLCKEMKKPEHFIEGVPAMIRLSGKSHAHLCRMFKEWEHETPLQYLNRIKLQYAENLLLHSDWSILDISLEAGYGNLGHFYKSFKKLFGRTPQAHRKMHHTKLTPLI
ncbi:AraC family transcriptional regulator [Paenibacillus sp. 79R4]|uniref:helix-turn-helix domain-containing protein n=1 Tax=Paenibacillus sp. 79R4 TaxID=2212847 RepID=UPI0015C0575B|nr:helix-turn-helix domain-containing protein [Paenibacillus sp. 79R4]NWL87765.1 AraC family transcriptional regulator [Paenibacillus sp. 79R4]